jgi:hypothetical protein
MFYRVHAWRSYFRMLVTLTANDALVLLHILHVHTITGRVMFVFCSFTALNFSGTSVLPYLQHTVSACVVVHVYDANIYV